MSSLSRGTIQMTLGSLQSAKWRSMLTMLGIIIGIVAVVVVVGIGEGVKRDIAKQLGFFGNDLITVRPGADTKTGAQAMLNGTDLLFGMQPIGGLTQKDLATVRASRHVAAAAPLAVVAGVPKVDNNQPKDVAVVATNTDLPTVLKQRLAYGDFFAAPQAGDDSVGVVLGEQAAEALFNDSVPLGRTLQLRGQTFVVRGVFDQFPATPLSPTASFNNAIFIPFETAATITDNTVQMYTILAKPDTAGNRTAAIQDISAHLLTQHAGTRDFQVRDSQQSLAMSNGVLSLLTTMVVAIAAISLLVGGVGIMNIMLASVTERTHEIGVRKAIGATNRQILNQFLLESTVISVVGGVIGVVISVATIGLLSVYTDLRPVLSWQAVAIATGVSLAIGILFGTVPAIKAARKNPIDALRHQ